MTFSTFLVASAREVHHFGALGLGLDDLGWLDDGKRLASSSVRNFGRNFERGFSYAVGVGAASTRVLARARSRARSR